MITRDTDAVEDGRHKRKIINKTLQRRYHVATYNSDTKTTVLDDKTYSRAEDARKFALVKIVDDPDKSGTPRLWWPSYDERSRMKLGALALWDAWTVDGTTAAMVLRSAEVQDA